MPSENGSASATAAGMFVNISALFGASHVGALIGGVGLVGKWPTEMLQMFQIEGILLSTILLVSATLTVDVRKYF